MHKSLRDYSANWEMFVHDVQFVKNLDDKWQILGKFCDAMMGMDLKINAVVWQGHPCEHSNVLNKWWKTRVNSEFV